MFDPQREILRSIEPVGMTGRVHGVRGLTVSVSDLPVPMGAGCRIVHGSRSREARVIGFAGDQTLIMPLGPMDGICRGDRVVFTSSEQSVMLGDAMLGRVLDGLAQPIDGLGELQTDTRAAIWPEPIAPMQRLRITEPMATGVRAIDSMLTVGCGQRMGIFSGSGVGKSVLLGMIGRHTSADVVVIALIGERGREVRDFIERDLGPDGLKKAVVVVSTSDEPPLLRLQAAGVAAAVAEYFRSRGKNVVLLMDSLTRLATAQRQIGLAAGEPPATKGYPPSVFNLLPKLLERTGRTADGAITAFYTVLVEGDDPSEPVSDAVRAVTDGHIMLSRELANRGYWPAVDVLASISRVMIDVADDDHRAAARQIQQLIAAYTDVEDLINIGAYQSGASVENDLAVKMIGPIQNFLTQAIDETSSFERTREALLKLRCLATELRNQPRAAVRNVASV